MTDDPTDAIRPDHPVTSSAVRFAGDGGRATPARVWRPEQGGPFPGVVFISEAFRLTTEMERLGRMVASWGYVVLAPDLFADGTWVTCLRRLIRDLGRGGGGSAETLRRGRDFLATQPGVDGVRLGVLGFCLGGRYALLLAKHELFEVAAAFYGQAPEGMDGACPVVASYGGRDRILAPSAPKLRAELERQGVDHDVKVYPDAGHAFMNDAPNALVGLAARLSPVHAGYHAAAAADATARDDLPHAGRPAPGLRREEVLHHRGRRSGVLPDQPVRRARERAEGRVMLAHPASVRCLGSVADSFQ